MGSTTYEWIVDHEDLRNQPEKWAYRQPTWVFSSRTLPAIPGADVRFVAGDVAPVHAQMLEAAQGKNVWLVGGGDLVGQFHDQRFARRDHRHGDAGLPRRRAHPCCRAPSRRRH